MGPTRGSIKDSHRLKLGLTSMCSSLQVSGCSVVPTVFLWLVSSVMLFSKFLSGQMGICKSRRLRAVGDCIPHRVWFSPAQDQEFSAINSCGQYLPTNFYPLENQRTPWIQWLESSRVHFTICSLPNIPFDFEGKVKIPWDFAYAFRDLIWISFLPSFTLILLRSYRGVTPFNSQDVRKS